MVVQTNTQPKDDHNTRKKNKRDCKRMEISNSLRTVAISTAIYKTV